MDEKNVSHPKRIFVIVGFLIQRMNFPVALDLK